MSAPRTYITRGGEVREVPAPLRKARKPRADGLSATQALTKRNNELLERGVHPATHLPLNRAATCGSCAHHHVTHDVSRRFHKCDLHRLGQSHSSASDIRVSWPACALFERSETDQEGQ